MLSGCVGAARFNFAAGVAMARSKHSDASEQEVKVWLEDLVDLGLVLYEDGQWCQVRCPPRCAPV